MRVVLFAIGRARSHLVVLLNASWSYSGVRWSCSFEAIGLEVEYVDGQISIEWRKLRETMDSLFDYLLQMVILNVVVLASSLR